MDKIYPYGETSGDFVDADVTNGIRGSKVPAKFFNDIQAEIIAAIEAAGLTPDGSKLTQLAEAIQAMANSGNADLSDYATQKYVNDQIDAIPSLGVDQSWKDVKNERATGIIYRNNTDKPIFVIVGLYRSGTNPISLQFEVDGVTGIGRIDYNDSSGSVIGNVSVIVPAGSNYKAVANNGSTLNNWHELR